MKLKKIISVLLALVMIFAVASISASAADSSQKTYVARMYICTRTKVSGHAWLYFENLTNGTIRVGCYDLPAGQGVTVSTYNTSRKDGKGNYYNIDGYCLNKYGSSKTVCASTELTKEQLKTASAKILSMNTWTGTKNCCYFAGTVWNSVASNKVKILLTPPLMSIKIKKIKCATPKFYYPTKDQCFKQVGTGANATLKPCSSGSFKKYVG